MVVLSLGGVGELIGGIVVGRVSRGLGWAGRVSQWRGGGRGVTESVGGGGGGGEQGESVGDGAGAGRVSQWGRGESVCVCVGGVGQWVGGWGSVTGGGGGGGAERVGDSGAGESVGGDGGGGGESGGGGCHGQSVWG